MAQLKRKFSISGRVDRVLRIYAAYLGVHPDTIIRTAVYNQLKACLKAINVKGKINKTDLLHQSKGGEEFLKAAKKFDTWEQVVGSLDKKEASGEATTDKPA